MSMPHTHKDQWSVEKGILLLSLLPDNAAVANMGKSAATASSHCGWGSSAAGWV